MFLSSVDNPRILVLVLADWKATSAGPIFLSAPCSLAESVSHQYSLDSSLHRQDGPGESITIACTCSCETECLPARPSIAIKSPQRCPVSPTPSTLSNRPFDQTLPSLSRSHSLFPLPHPISHPSPVLCFSRSLSPRPSSSLVLHWAAHTFILSRPLSLSRHHLINLVFKHLVITDAFIKHTSAQQQRPCRRRPRLLGLLLQAPPSRAQTLSQPRRPTARPSTRPLPHPHACPRSTVTSTRK